MKIYLAAWYSRNPEMRGYRDELVAAGHEVICTWINQHEGELEQAMNSGDVADNPAAAARFAEQDLLELAACDLLVFFGSPNGEGRGGRWVELGYAIGTQKEIAIIGKLENVFCALPEISSFRDWAEFRKYYLGIPTPTQAFRAGGET